MPSSNRWNQTIYRLWAPVYDRLFGRLLQGGRRAALEQAGLRPGERALIVGVGTGADLPLLPTGVQVVGIDLSVDMLRRAAPKRSPARVLLLQADAHRLPLSDASVDVVLLPLVLSVVPDPQRALREALRAVRPGGRMVVFDKFVADGHKAGWLRRLLAPAIRRLGTDITRRLKDILADAPVTVVADQAAGPRGLYRVVHLSPTSSGPR